MTLHSLLYLWMVLCPRVLWLVFSHCWWLYALYSTCGWFSVIDSTVVAPTVDLLPTLMTTCCGWFSAFFTAVLAFCGWSLTTADVMLALCSLWIVLCGMDSLTLCSLRGWCLCLWLSSLPCSQEELALTRSFSAHYVDGVSVYGSQCCLAYKKSYCWVGPHMVLSPLFFFSKLMKLRG